MTTYRSSSMKILQIRRPLYLLESRQKPRKPKDSPGICPGTIQDLVHHRGKYGSCAHTKKGLLQQILISTRFPRRHIRTQDDRAHERSRWPSTAHHSSPRWTSNVTQRHSLLFLGVHPQRCVNGLVRPGRTEKGDTVSGVRSFFPFLSMG